MDLPELRNGRVSDVGMQRPIVRRPAGGVYGKFTLINCRESYVSTTAPHTPYA